MSGCHRRLSALLDGELGPQERALTEEHLAGCGECREEAGALREQGEGLRRALGGLLLHVDLAKTVAASLPEKRRSMVMVKTQGVRRQLALAGFGVALALVVVSLLHAGARAVFNPLAGLQQQAALLLDWALMLAAGSMMIWPEKIAWAEARVLAVLRGSRPEVSPRERVLVQGLGLLFLCVATAFHFLLLRHL